MEFSLDRFYQINRKTIIWLVLFALIYVLRDFFTLIFLTFIISFFAYPACRFCQDRLRLGKTLSVVFVYLLITAGFFSAQVMLVRPVITQTSSIQAKLPEIEQTFDRLRVQVTERFPNFASMLNLSVEDPELAEEDIGPRNWERLVYQLANCEFTPLGADLLGALRPEARSMLIRVAACQEPRPANGSLSPDDDSGNAGPGTLDDESKARLLDAINNDLLTKPDLYEFPYRAQLVEHFERVQPFPELETLLTQYADQTIALRDLMKLNRALLETHVTFLPPREYRAERLIDEGIAQARTFIGDVLPNVALYILTFLLNSLLAILFSFLILFDYARLSKEIKGLQHSRLRDFFVEAGQPVVRFAISVGQAFRAIAIIAFITTLMVIPVLWVLDISSIAFLALIAFVTSLIPVVGILFEMIPVGLVALNEGGADVAFWALAALGVIHIIIGYVITPIIFGRQFKLNAVAIIFVLFIGNQIAGVWGVILGVPIANYLLRDVLGVPSDDKPAIKEALAEASKAD